VPMGYIAKAGVAAVGGVLAQMYIDRRAADYKKANSSATPAQVETEVQKQAALAGGGLVVLGAVAKGLQYGARQRWADVPGDGLVQAGATILGMVLGGYADTTLFKVPDPPVQGGVPQRGYIPPSTPPEPIGAGVPPMPRRLATRASWLNGAR